MVARKPPFILAKMPAFVGVGSLDGYDCTKCISFYPRDQHRDGGLSYLRLVVGGVNVHHPHIRLTIAKTWENRGFFNDRRAQICYNFRWFIGQLRRLKDAVMSKVGKRIWTTKNSSSSPRTIT